MQVINIPQDTQIFKFYQKNEKFLKSYKKTFETVFSSHLKISLIIKKKL